jgi:anti-sigma regulatory factor (Ser/Thr protein kinase)
MVLTMPADATSVALARHRVIGLLRANGWEDERIDEVALMTTELTTNAVEHAGTAFTMVAQLTGHALRVAIRDASTVLPVPDLILSPNAISGRGLAFVAEFADRWGYDPESDGKLVWFESHTT